MERKRKPRGWKYEPQRHSLARKGIKTNSDTTTREFKPAPLKEMRFFHFTPLEYIYFGEQSAPYQSDDPAEDFFEDMLEYGYEKPFDWYWGHGPELIITSSEMYSDPRVLDYFKKRAITEKKNLIKRR